MQCTLPHITLEKTEVLTQGARHVASEHVPCNANIQMLNEDPIVLIASMLVCYDVIVTLRLRFMDCCSVNTYVYTWERSETLIVFHTM